jgi:O-antigen/teichoic acid export membrane protein
MVGFSLLADPGIILLYGSGMTKSIVLLQLLVPAGALRSVAAPAGLIYSALGRTGLALNWNIFAACVMVGALVLGLKGGVEGVALAVSLSAILLALVSQFLVQRLVGFTMGEFFRSLAPAIGGSLGMLVCVITFKWIFLPNLPIWLFLPCCVLIGMSAYVASIRFLGRGIFYEATGLLQAALRRH